VESSNGTAVVRGTTPWGHSALSALSWLLLLLAPAGCDDGATPPSELRELGLLPVAEGLAIPVHLAAPPGDDRLFVVEREGRIRVVRDGELLAEPFLDISPRVTCCHEEGLLSVAFDPDYATSGRFWVFFVDENGDIAIERYAADPESDVAEPAPTPVLSIPHPSAIHHGGLLQFGPDGMLYVSTGDGEYGDPAGNAQNLNSLLGKILRLDVRDPDVPYAIPASNPWAGEAGRRGEIWAYGLRNPWRYDVAPGAHAPDLADLWVADVGHERYEEVDAVPGNPGGTNFGWNVMEGTRCFPPGSTCDDDGLLAPAHEYSHALGCSVIGGFVYRGSAVPELEGHYLFADYCEGWLASLTGDPVAGWTRHDWVTPAVGNITSFGMDGDGEAYVVTEGGFVYRIAPAD
jgi:glucose/arabinose dehydrogenase